MLAIGLVVLGLCVTGILVSGGADSDIDGEFTQGALCYKIIPGGSKEVEVIGYEGYLTECTIPSSVIYLGDTYAVVSIAPRSFVSSAISSVTINEGVESIGRGAFTDCRRLLSVTIPDSVTSIGDSAFAFCTNLTDVDVGPGNLTYRIVDDVLYTNDVRELVLYPCGLSGPFTVPDGVERLGNYAFCGASHLPSLTLPDGLVAIGEYAFRGCTSLTSVSMPDSVTEIGNCAFMSCMGLSHVTIPAKVKEIRESTFEGCQSLTSVSMHDNITNMGTGAFKYCTKLTAVTMPLGLTDIPESAFEGCASLTSVTLNNVTSIGNCAFKNCVMLGSITFPDGFKDIYPCAFEGCDGLTSVEFPATITNIFYYAFKGCEGITGFRMGSGNEYYRVIDGVLFFLSPVPILFQYPCGREGPYVAPNGTEVIGGFAFEGCDGLTSVTLPEGLTTIDYGAFAGCTGLTSVTLPEGLTTIGNSAFQGCTDLDGLTLPAGVKSIGSYAFKGCVGLTSFDLPDGLEHIGTSAFDGCSCLVSVTIPDSVSSINFSSFKGCMNLVEFIAGPGNETYSSKDGVLLSKDGRTVVQYPIGRAGPYEIPEGVESVGAYLFDGCTKLTSVTLPDSVLSIGHSAFAGCTALVSVSLSSNLKSMDSSVFAGCTALTSITLPDGMTSIGSFAFRGCTALTSMTLPDGIAHIEPTVFLGCIGIKEFIVGPGSERYSAIDGVLFSKDGKTLVRYPCAKEGEYRVPDKVTHIENLAFMDCKGLTSITLPTAYNFSLDVPPFYGCSNLTDISISDPSEDMVTSQGVLYIDDMSVLIRCPEGKTGVLTLPLGVTYISWGALSNSKLDALVIRGGDRILLGDGAFIGCNPNMMIESGRVGYGLEIYKDVGRTDPMTLKELSSGDYTVIYLKWVGAPEPEPPGPSPPEPDAPAADDTPKPVKGMVIGAVIGVAALVGVAALLFLRRKF